MMDILMLLHYTAYDLRYFNAVRYLMAIIWYLDDVGIRHYKLDEWVLYDLFTHILTI